jgi:hypothetical protein
VQPALRAVGLRDFLRNLLTKTEITAIRILHGGIARRLADSQARTGLRLFENRPDHNPPREPGREGDFLTYIARNPLKRLDSQK